MDTSYTFTLNGKSSILEEQYFPPIQLSPNKNHVMGLVELLTFNSIPNIDEKNNKFYCGGHIFYFPTGSYEIQDIEKYLKEVFAKHESSKNIVLSLKPNNNTLCSVIKCSHPIDFRPKDSIASLLGFTERVLEANITHTSDLPVTILKINALRVECNITTGAYVNGHRAHTIHEFFPAVPPGYKIIEVPSNVIYLPVSVKSIDHLELRIVDQDGNLVNFRNELITVRLHLKSL